MGFSVSRTVWLHNDYGVEFTLTDPHFIVFKILVERDKTLIEDNKVCIASGSCTRKGEEESLQDFAKRAHEEGISFSRVSIVEHKTTLDLFTILGEVLDAAE